MRALIRGTQAQISSSVSDRETGRCMARKSSSLPASSESRSQSPGPSASAISSSRSPRLPFETTAIWSESPLAKRTKRSKPGCRVGSPPPIRIRERRPRSAIARMLASSSASSWRCRVFRMSQSMQWSQR